MVYFQYHFRYHWWNKSMKKQRPTGCTRSTGCTRPAGCTRPTGWTRPTGCAYCLPYGMCPHYGIIIRLCNSSQSKQSYVMQCIIWFALQDVPTLRDDPVLQDVPALRDSGSWLPELGLPTRFWLAHCALINPPTSEIILMGRTVGLRHPKTCDISTKPKRVWLLCENLTN